MENTSGHARVSLLVVSCPKKVRIIIRNLHFFFIHIYDMKKMSVRKWKQKAAETSAVGKQTHDILTKFKMNNIGKEFGQLSGEELFKPITKRLD